ncbi:MAG TPA: hypothetical protein VFT22_14525, partial [Kofleriaceae bacterium]|nr:hypothetical protein [Kofleriaceae bacterium]
MWAPHESRSRVIDLPSAGLPADRGLASLGLVMQLAGRITAGLAALIAALVASGIASAGVLAPHVRHHAGWFVFAIAASLARSQLHRMAGRDLVDPRRTADGA